MSGVRYKINLIILKIVVTTLKIFRCVDVWPGEGIVVAVGQAGGRVSFSSFRDGEAGHLLGHTLAPRTPRTCTGKSVIKRIRYELRLSFIHHPLIYSTLQPYRGSLVPAARCWRRVTRSIATTMR